MNDLKLSLIRYLRGLGWQQEDIAQAIGVTRQTVAYQLKKIRSATIEMEDTQDSDEGGVVSLLVGYVSDPPSPSQEDMDHSCPTFVQMATYAQLEDLPKHQKIGVLLAVLAEVEAE